MIIHHVPNVQVGREVPSKKKTNVQIPSKTPHSIVRSAVGRIWLLKRSPKKDSCGSSNHHFFRCLNHFWRYIFAMKNHELIMSYAMPWSMTKPYYCKNKYIWRKKLSILFPYSIGENHKPSRIRVYTPLIRIPFMTGGLKNPQGCKMTWVWMV